MLYLMQSYENITRSSAIRLYFIIYIIYSIMGILYFFILNKLWVIIYLFKSFELQSWHYTALYANNILSSLYDVYTKRGTT